MLRTIFQKTISHKNNAVNYFIAHKNASYQQHFTSLIDKFLRYCSSCYLCQSTCEHYSGLCQHCYKNLPFFNYQHLHGDLLNWPAIYKQLPHIHFDQLITLAPHKAPFNQWISQLKYQGRFEIAKLLAHLLADLFIQQQKMLSINVSNTQILSVPIHVSRWQQRGFNQAHLIAKYFQQQLNKQHIVIPYCPAVLYRQKATEAQVGKSGAQRRKNLRSAFKVYQPKALAEHILLIDDVVTTGTTASVISQQLKQHGVKTVTVLAITLAY